MQKNCYNKGVGSNYLICTNMCTNHSWVEWPNGGNTCEVKPSFQRIVLGWMTFCHSPSQQLNTPIKAKARALAISK